MRLLTRKRGWLLVIGLALAVTATACEETPNDFPAETVPDAPATPGAPAEETFPGANGGLERDGEPPTVEDPEYSSVIDEVDGSGITGDLAMASDEDGFALVHATIEGLADDESYTGNILEGSCGARGELVFALGVIDEIEEERASFLVLVEVPAENLADGDYVFVVSEGAETFEEDAIVACGEFAEGGRAAE